MFDFTTQLAPASGIKKVILCDTVPIINGMTYDNLTGILTSTTQGVFRLITLPQFVTGGGGAGKVEVSWEIDTGTGFVTILGSPITESIAAVSDAVFSSEAWLILNVGDKVRPMWATSSASINIIVPPSLVSDTIPSVQQYITHHGN